MAATLKSYVFRERSHGGREDRLFRWWKIGFIEQPNGFYGSLRIPTPDQVADPSVVKIRVKAETGFDHGLRVWSPLNVRNERETWKTYYDAWTRPMIARLNICAKAGLPLAVNLGGWCLNDAFDYDDRRQHMVRLAMDLHKTLPPLDLLAMDYEQDGTSPGQIVALASPIAANIRSNFNWSQRVNGRPVTNQLWFPEVKSHPKLASGLCAYDAGHEPERFRAMMFAHNGPFVTWLPVCFDQVHSFADDRKIANLEQIKALSEPLVRWAHQAHRLMSKDQYPLFCLADYHFPSADAADRYCDWLNVLLTQLDNDVWPDWAHTATQY